jgi:hypothetical protein
MRTGFFKDAEDLVQALMMAITSMQPATTIFLRRIVALAAIGDKGGPLNMEIHIQEVSKHLKRLFS